MKMAKVTRSRSEVSTSIVCLFVCLLLLLLWMFKKKRRREEGQEGEYKQGKNKRG